MADLATKYQKKSDKQHVLDNPDTYIGSMESTDYSTMYTRMRPRVLLQRICGLFLVSLYLLLIYGLFNSKTKMTSVL